MPAGKGAIMLNITGFQRTIITEEQLTKDDFVKFILEFTHIDDSSKDEVFNKTDSNIHEPVLLNEGTYNLVIYAYTNTTDAFYVAEYRENGILIEPGQTTTRSITLTVVPNGTGTFSWNITYPAGLTSGKMDVTKQTDTSPIVTETENFIVTSTNNFGTNSNMTSGYYSVLVTLSKTGASDIERREILHIYNSMTSHYEFTFLDSHFNMEVFNVTFNFNGADGVLLPMQQSVFHGELLQKPADPKRAGYVFKGWYTALSDGTEYTFTSTVTSNITLYARWEALPNLNITAQLDYEDDIVLLADSAPLPDDEPITIIKNLGGTITPATFVIAIESWSNYSDFRWQFDADLRRLTISINNVYTYSIGD